MRVRKDRGGERGTMIVVSVDGSVVSVETSKGAIMQHGELTREQAIKRAGIAAVEAVEAENCEPTGRCGYNGACQDDALIEWSASVKAVDSDGDEVALIVYYYTDQADSDAMDAAYGDGSVIDWTVYGYEIRG